MLLGADSMSVAPVSVGKRQSRRTLRLKPQRGRRGHLGRHVEVRQKLETAWNCSPARAERCDRRGGHGQTPQEGRGLQPSLKPLCNIDFHYQSRLHWASGQASPRVVLPGVNARAEVQTCSSPSSGEGRREAITHALTTVYSARCRSGGPGDILIILSKHVREWAEPGS